MALVFGVAQLLGRGAGSEQTPTAQHVSVGSSSDGLTPSAGATASPLATGKPSQRPARKTKTPLAVPTGPCADSDVVAEPSVGQAFAAHDVRITVSLTTVEAAACNFEVSPQSLAVKVTSGQDRVWSSQDCKAAVLPAAVVVRQDVPATVGVTWSGQRSDADCSRTTAWSQPGYYHVEAAVVGADPSEVQFYLGTAPRRTITPSPKRATKTSSAGPTEKPQPTKKSRPASSKTGR